MGLTRPRLGQLTTTTSAFDDPIVVLNNSASGSNTTDIGIVFERGDDQNRVLLWDESADEFVLANSTEQGSTNGDVSLAAYAPLQVAGLKASSLTLIGGNLDADSNDILNVDTLRINQSGTGLRMTNVGAFDNDGSDNFRIFATNDLQLKANGDSGGGLTIDVTNNNVTIDNDLHVSAGQFYYGGTAVTSTAAELNLLDGVTGLTLGNANEILIVGTGGTSITSTSVLSIDNTNNYIGINQTSPEVTLHMTGEGAQTAQIRMEQYNDSADAPDIRTRRYRGTIASPAAIQSGDYLFRSNHEYYNGSALIVGGQFAFDNTNNANRTQFTVAVTTDGTSVEASSNDDVQFKIDGNDSGAITFNNAYKFPTSDGSANQVLATDGSGTISFVDVATTLDAVTDNGATTTNAITVGGLTTTSALTLNAQNQLRFADSDSSAYVGFKSPATVASNIMWTLPASDGTEGQVLSTNGGGTLAWADPGTGGGSGSSYPNSTFSTLPGSEGDFDLSYNVAQDTQETPFEASGTDAFGVNLGSVFSMMDPVGTSESTDLGVLT
jgi:hypothetical protein